jgi:hypothetical protein
MAKCNLPTSLMLIVEVEVPLGHRAVSSAPELSDAGRLAY